MQNHSLVENDLLDRIDWLIRLRWLAVVGTLQTIGLVSLVWHTAGEQGLSTTGSLLSVAVGIGLYNLAFLAHTRRIAPRLAALPAGRVLVRLACAQIGLDLAALALLIHLAGGIENPAALFLVFHIIIAGIVLGQPISYLAAGLASALFLAISGLEYIGRLPHYHLPMLDIELYREPFYVLGTNAAMTLTLFIAAYLTTSITMRLRQRKQELPYSYCPLSNALRTLWSRSSIVNGLGNRMTPESSMPC